MPDDTPPSSPNSSPSLRARRWSRPTSSSPGRRTRPNRFAIRLIGIPAAAIAGVFLYSGVRDRMFLPDCDSDRAKHTLTDVLKQLQLEPTHYEPITTVSAGKEEVVCKADLPLPAGGNVTVDYSFYWDGGKASMKYSIAHKSP